MIANDRSAHYVSSWILDCFLAMGNSLFSPTHAWNNIFPPWKQGDTVDWLLRVFPGIGNGVISRYPKVEFQEK